MEPSSKTAANTNKNENEKKEEKKEKIMVTPPEDFDLESYISHYTGHTRIMRLMFIGDHCKELEKESFRRALDEIKKTLNTALYRSIVEKMGDQLGVTLDTAWIENADRKAAQTQERLDLELNQAKQSLQKDGIRRAYNELGQLHYERGDLNSSLRCYLRIRDYCTNSKHMLEMCMNVIKVSIEMANYSHVSSYVSKAEQTSENSNDKILLSKLRVCNALSQLDSKKYKPAARKFLETTIDIGENFSEVILPVDIANYTGLMALATFERPELKKRVIDNIAFATFFEFTVDLRELINDFYSSNYASCLKRLDRLKSTFLLDMYLHEHVEILYQKIRNNALVEYFKPFSSIDLNIMAQAFNTTVPGLEKELSKLIMEDAIAARIDSHNKRLYARKTDQRTVTFEKTLRVGEEFQVNTKAMLLRLNLMRNELTVKPPRRGGDEGPKERKGFANVAALVRNF